MPDVLQCASEPRVTPRRVLLDHPNHQSPDLREHARTTALPLHVRPLARDQLPMPAENHVRPHDRGDLAQSSTAQPVPADGQPTPLLIA
jgi:hypothetical protein